MILILQIGMVVMGIMAIVTGKLTLTKQRVVRGLAARLLGVLGLLPLPICLTIGFVIGVRSVVQGVPLEVDMVSLALTEAGITIGTVIIIYAIGLPLAQPPQKVPYLDDDEDDEWEERRRQRRRRRREEERDADEPEPAPPQLEAEPPASVAPVPPAPSEPLRFRCTGCAALMQVQPQYAGRKVRCPKCQATLQAPEASQAQPTPLDGVQVLRPTRND